jgi:hypothetical protein
MKQAILVTDKVGNLNELIKLTSDLVKFEQVNDFQGNILFQEEILASDFLSVTLDDNIDTLWENGEKEQLQLLYSTNRHCWLFDFNNYLSFRLFIRSLRQDFDFLIYNDFGYFYTRQELLTKYSYEDFIAKRSDLFR